MQKVPISAKKPQNIKLRHEAYLGYQRHAILLDRSSCCMVAGVNTLVSSLPLLRSHGFAQAFIEVTKHTEIHTPQKTLPTRGCSKTAMFPKVLEPSKCD